MAKNVQGVIFLRNGRLYDNRTEAISRINAVAATIGDGEAILARYTAEDTTVKTIVGFKYVGASASSLTLIDVEGLIGDAKALVDALRAEIEAKLGNGVTSANTATAQLAALSGGTFTPGSSNSGDTSISGAKEYAYDLLGTLDYTDTAVTGSYVSEVTQSDGKIISTTKVELPSLDDEAVAKKVVIAVSEDKGQIEVSRGEITSSAETIVLSDNADGGINFEVNIDNATIVQGDDKKLKVADSALTQNYGDEKTIHATVDSANNTKTFSTLLQLSATTVTETNVKEQFNLVNASGETIGATIKIYKDSSLYNVYLGHMDDTIAGDPPVVTPGTGDTALCFIYHKEDGSYELVPVNVESFLEESEFESGVTATNHIVHGVVDPASEKDGRETSAESFLTVGADGFKISGIKDEIDRKLNAIVEDLDATVTDATSGNHVTITIEELDGKLVQSGLTIEENDIASASDLAALSAKTVTALTSTNGSITAQIDDAAGCKTYDIQTDADKIKMSGFTVSGTSSFSGITNDDTIADAFDKANAVITENERITAAALNDLNDKIEAVSGASLSGVSVNNVALTKTNNAVNVQISGSTAAPSGTLNDPAIIVTTDNSTGAVTIGLGYIDCGTYDD